MNLVALLVTLSTYMRSYFGTIRGNVEVLARRLNEHVLSRNNPNGVTKKQVGLGKVQDYPPATKEQAEEGKSGQVVMTPRRTGNFIDKQFCDPMIAVLDKAIEDLD